MSRRRRRDRRDANVIANETLPVSSNSSPRRSSPLRLYEDRRQFHPQRDHAPARSFNRYQHQLRVPRSRKRYVTRETPRNPDAFAGLRNNFTNTVPHAIGFDRPDKVLICVRRQMRKEVLFAKRKTGRRGQRRPRYGWYSKITCRR